MDAIQRELIKVGLKDLAQEYYRKVAINESGIDKFIKRTQQIFGYIEMLINDIDEYYSKNREVADRLKEDIRNAIFNAKSGEWKSFDKAKAIRTLENNLKGHIKFVK